MVDSLMADFFPTGYSSEPTDDSGITVAGVKIANREAITRYSRNQLEKRLPDVPTFKTCEDFKHLNAECCDSCHSYAIYELEAVPLPEGGYFALVCCAIDRAIRPEWHAEPTGRDRDTVKVRRED